jgi:hypothetical protein
MQLRHFAAMLSLAMGVVACDSSREPTIQSGGDTVQTDSKSDQVSSAKPSQTSLSSDLADMYLGLVQDSNMRPDVNAVDTYAKAFAWKPTSPEMNALLNAERGYVGKLGESTVLLGSDGSNDIFSIAVRDNFEPAEILDSMRQVITARKVAADESMGQVLEMYRITDGATDLGIMSLTYGTAPSIRGTGTVSYLSADRARAEGIGVK